MKSSVAGVLCFVLAAGPAYALRQPNPQEGRPEILAGMEEKIRSTHPAARSAGMEEGMQKLGQLRSSVADLPTYSVSTAWLWGTLDFLLRSGPAPGFVGQVSQEYTGTRKWLRGEYPDLESPTTVDLLVPVERTTVASFKIKTSTGLYLLAVQTQDINAGGSGWTHVRLAEVESGQSYRLEEIVTGESFPWDPPYHYIGSYLRGETDRFGDPHGQERWGIKPGDRKGDFQLFRIAAAEGLVRPLQWADLLAPAVASPAAPLVFSRSTESQKHSLIKDPDLGMAADVITGKPFAGGGSLLMVTFPNGNSGVAMRDSTVSQPLQVQKVQAVSRMNGSQRGVVFQVGSAASAISFGEVVLDTVRHLREWNSWDGGRTRAAKYSEFVDAVRRLPRQVLVDLRREGVPLVELSRRISPRLFYRRTQHDQSLYIFRLTMGGHLYLVEMIFPPSYDVRWTPQGKIDISSKRKHPLKWRMVVTTDFPALTPIPREELLGKNALAYGENSAILQREFDDLEFLASKQFFAAGSHRFLQFFGRDTLIWLRMFAPLLTTQAHQTALQGVLDRVSPEGRLPSVEELDDQFAYELVEGFCWTAQRINEKDGLERLYGSARTLGEFARGNRPQRDLKYGVPDVDMMLLPAVADYLRREDIPLDAKMEFFRQQGPSGASNLTAVLRNADWVMRTAMGYIESRRAGEPWPAGLVGAKNEGDFANWRDVQYGLGYGLYPQDVNAEWIPASVQASREVLRFVWESPLGESGQLAQMIRTGGLQALDSVMKGKESLALFQEFGTAWKEVQNRFTWRLSPEEIRARLGLYVRQLPPQERNWLLGQQLGGQIRIGHFLQAGGPVPSVLQPGMTYFPVSLDRAGQPVPVVASDGILALLDPALPAWRLTEILTPLMLPYPVGLWTPAGFLVASSALSNSERLWQEISRTSYGGSVVYGWQMEFLKQGLFRQMMRQDLSDPQLRSVLYSAFEACCEATPPQMIGQELWSWDVGEKGFRPVTFGELPGHNDESNPVQLWSLSAAEILRPQVREAAQQQALPLLREGELLDSLAQLRQRYPRPEISTQQAAGAEEKMPRIASMSMSLPPGGGGVNIVFANQVALFQAGGYPLTVLGGQVITMPPEMKANPPKDNAYTRAGMRLQIIDGLDLQGYTERDVREGRLDVPLFNHRVGLLMEKIEQAISDAQVVLIHQYMTMPSNLLVVEAMGRLARKYQGQKRFIAWVHNVLPGKAQGWPMKSITEMDPRMEYVAVSPDLRNQTLQLFGMGRWPWMMGAIKNSISVMNFFDTNPRVLDAYFSHRLYDAEYLLFYPARLVETKEIAGAIAAVHHARQRGHDVRLVISTTGYEGKIPPEAQTYYQHLLELRDKWGLTENEVLIYLHEPSHEDLKSQKEIRDWLFLSDALMFSSQQETAGIPVKEAKMARRTIFHTNLPVLNSETEGLPHVIRFKPREGWENEEGYGSLIAGQVVKFLESAEGKTDVSQGRAQKWELKQSFEGLLAMLSSWLNLPPPNKRLIRAGTRNFASTGRLVEESIRDAADAGYRAFQVNFEGFEPGAIKEEGIRKVREAAAGLRLTSRLTNFPSYPPEQAEKLLRDAAVFAMETGAQGISLPARGLDPARAEMIVRLAEWAKEEAVRRDIPLPDVLFSVENAWREDHGEWNEVAPEVLRDYFAGKPVGLSLWVDSFRARDVDSALSYVDAARLKLNTAYVGDDFFQDHSRNLFDKARVLLVEMHRRHWNGDLIGQSIVRLHYSDVRIQDFKSDRELEELKVAFLNRVIAEAYLPEDTSLSLRNSGELVGSPSMEARPPVQEAGLEEVFQRLVPSTIQAQTVHVLDPANADVGLFLSRVQQDPVVILAAGAEEERQLRRAGFVGDNRIILLVSSFDSVGQARAAAVALFPGYSARYYLEEERAKLRLWLAWVLERYDLTNLTVGEAAEIIEEISTFQAA